MTNIKKVTLKNGDIRYQFNAYLGIDPITQKKKRTTRRFKTKKEAQVALAKLQLQIENQGVSSVNRYTFKEVYNLWISNHQHEIRDTSLASKESKFKARILPAFGHIPIQDITKMYCQKVVNDWAKKLRAFHDYVIQANLVFEYAKRMEIIETNPMEFVTIPRKKEEKYYVKEEKNFFTKDELNQFLNIIKTEENLPSFVLYRILAFTGLRKGEALALHWSDINFKDETLTVDKTLVPIKSEHRLHHPKTKASFRTISVDRVTLTILKKWKTEQKETYKEFGFQVDTDLTQPIFTRYLHEKNKMDYYRLATPNERLKAFFERHPKFPKITIHGFRHTHASLLFEAGASIKDVQVRLGHNDIQTTMNIYTHITKTSREKVAQLFQNYIDF